MKWNNESFTTLQYRLCAFIHGNYYVNYYYIAILSQAIRFPSQFYRFYHHYSYFRDHCILKHRLNWEERKKSFARIWLSLNDFSLQISLYPIIYYSFIAHSFPRFCYPHLWIFLEVKCSSRVLWCGIFCLTIQHDFFSSSIFDSSLTFWYIKFALSTYNMRIPMKYKQQKVE